MNLSAKKCSRCYHLLPIEEFRYRQDKQAHCAMCRLCENTGKKPRQKPYVPKWVPNPLNAVLNDFKAAAEPANNGMFRRFA